MSTWLINGNPPEFYGVTVAGGQFASGSASTVRLETVAQFDAVEDFAYNSDVTLLRDGSPFFRGKVRQIPKFGSADAEGLGYFIEDAWAELERLTYQEPWLIRQADYTGEAYSPTVVLGMNSAGARINVGEQITEVLDFAVTAGVSLTPGTMPTGMNLWPSEVTGMSCAAVIRDCLKYYPDWIPWLDHTTSPPTFNVTPRATATVRTLPVTDCESINVSKTHDRVPAGVRIIYETASAIDDEVYRSMAIDQFPTVAPAVRVAAAGPGILCTTVPLAGMKMQIQKQQVQTRTIPEDETTAKAYLKKKFPFIAALPDEGFTVLNWTRTVVTEDEEEIDPIDGKLDRRLATTLAHMPRELVRGNVAEWMRRRVGKMRLSFTLTPVDVTPEQELLLKKVPELFTVTGTNATTKIYKGVSSYTAGEDIPVGIAQAYYETLLSGCYFAGSVSLIEADIGVTRWHGSTLNLSGGVGEWLSMSAPIHTVDWDLETCRTTINFGPNPDFSVQDFLEFLRLLNKRTHTEYSFAERSGEQLGATNKVSARGDTVGGFDVPETIYSGGAGGGSGVGGSFFTVYESEGDTYLQGGAANGGSGSVDGTLEAKLLYTEEQAASLPLPMSGESLYVKITVDGIKANNVMLPGLKVTAVAWHGPTDTAPTSVTPTLSATTGVDLYELIGQFTDTGFLPTASGNIPVGGSFGSYTWTR